ncbi:DUF4238 domain-containing protein [Kordiimonas aquimaris]|uniref:DUF4238 domain-containing protein n=1 Tax=Kordiimonas aquimaris TaxID=707591 RepID=UPI0021CF3D3B|nr:DUF4238 domain-containing protein [Kordiimonas aquimaris]
MPEDHFIPQFHQRLMMEDGDKWHFYEKARPHKGIQLRRPKTIFKQSNFYSKTNEQGENDRSVENKLGKLENLAAPILRSIISEAHIGKIANLNQVEHEILSIYLIVLRRRTVDAWSENKILSNFRESIEKYLHEFQVMHGELKQEVKEYFLSSEKLTEMRQNMWADGMLSVQGVTLNTFMNMGIGIALTPKNKSFIIGSSPVVRFENYPKQKLGEPGVELWVPISKKVAIIPLGKYPATKLIHLDTHKVRKLNESIYKQSTSIASSSATLLESLIKSKTTVII